MAEEKSPASLIHFPTETIHQILLFVSLNDIFTLSQTCKHFYSSISITQLIIDSCFHDFTTTLSIALNSTSGRKLIETFVKLQSRCSPESISKAWLLLGKKFKQEIYSEIQLEPFVTKCIVREAKLDLHGERNRIFRWAAMCGDWKIVHSLLDIASERGLDQTQIVRWTMGYASLFGKLEIAEGLFNELTEKGYQKFQARPVLALAVKNSASMGDMKILKLALDFSEILGLNDDIPVNAAVMLAKNGRHDEAVRVLQWFSVSRTATGIMKKAFNLFGQK
ncbi:hypothetical protein HK096_008342 [Nowakowskiella sp. JEL0078]|nr:hypothetical protein HK096_008342 [Nowakowskiella sp. JEL0078]